MSDETTRRPAAQEPAHGAHEPTDGAQGPTQGAQPRREAGTSDPPPTPADQQDVPDDLLAARADLVETEHDLEEGAQSEGALRAAEALRDVPAEPGVPKPDPILIADGITRRFGGVQAVKVDHVEVQRGTITALIGPNGAGKSTFFNLVSGFDTPQEGTWSFDGKDITGKPAYQIAQQGMVRTFQLTKALMRLTTLENAMLGAPDQKGERMWAAPLRFLWSGQEQAHRARAEELLERFRLTHMRDEYAGTMSGGQRKLLEMARALMCEPQMVMLDEPMAGVNPALTQSLLGHIQKLRDEGVTVVLVEHDMDVIMSISDWIVCFAEGKVIAEGRPSDIRTNTAVIDAYLGTRRALKQEEPAGGPAEGHGATPAARPDEQPRHPEEPA